MLIPPVHISYVMHFNVLVLKSSSDLTLLLLFNYSIVLIVIPL